METNNQPTENVEFRKYYVTLSPRMFKELNNYTEENKLTLTDKGRLLYFIGYVLIENFMGKHISKIDSELASMSNAIGNDEYKQIMELSIDVGIVEKTTDSKLIISSKYMKEPFALFPIYIDGLLHDFDAAYFRVKNMKWEAEHIFFGYSVGHLNNLFYRTVVDNSEIKDSLEYNLESILEFLENEDSILFHRLLNYGINPGYFTQNAELVDYLDYLDDLNAYHIILGYGSVSFSFHTLLFISILISRTSYQLISGNDSDPWMLEDVIQDLQRNLSQKTNKVLYYDTVEKLNNFFIEMKILNMRSDEDTYKYFSSMSVDLNELKRELQLMFSDISSQSFLTKNVGALDREGFNWHKLSEFLNGRNEGFVVYGSGDTPDKYSDFTKKMMLERSIYYFMEKDVELEELDFSYMLFKKLFPNMARYIHELKRQYGNTFLSDSAKLIKSLTKYFAFISLAEKYPGKVGISSSSIYLRPEIDDSSFESIYQASSVRLLGFVPPFENDGPFQ